MITANIGEIKNKLQNGYSLDDFREIELYIEFDLESVEKYKGAFMAILKPINPSTIDIIHITLYKTYNSLKYKAVLVDNDNKVFKLNILPGIVNHVLGGV